MKKLIVGIFILLTGMIYSQAQEGLMAVGHIGFITGNSSDYFGMNLGVDGQYLFPVTPEIKLGGIASLDMYTGKSITNTPTKMKGLTLLSIGGSGQYKIMQNFFAGLDLGYSISFNKDYGGGFFFQPKGGYEDEYFQAFIFIKNISSNLDNNNNMFKKFSSVTTFGIGGAYKF